MTQFRGISRIGEAVRGNSLFFFFQFSDQKSGQLSVFAPTEDALFQQQPDSAYRGRFGPEYAQPGDTDPHQQQHSGAGRH